MTSWIAHPVLPYARSYLVLISFLLPTMTRLIFNTFPCLELDTGERWLLADKSIDCDSAAHARMVAYVCERSERWVASEGRDGSRAKRAMGRERRER